MYFHSFEYIFVFLPCVWVFYILLRDTSFRTILLIASGYVFYAWGRPWIAILLFASSTIDFLIGMMMQSVQRQRNRLLLLVGSLVFNLGLLATFKYSPWIFGGINELELMKHYGYQLPILDAAMPPGISFYTFQSLAYIIDIYKRKIHAHRSALDYYAFVAFFPQLFAGPIERAGQLLPQIVHPPSIHLRMIEMGIFMIMWGLFKKLVIADNMGNLIDLTRSNMALPSTGIILALAFTFQIYADFSGYTDIARGSAKLFGIKLRRNFLTPYFASNPSDFWQRWHISLSSWIRDYIFIPLGGNRKGNARTLFNLIVTMFLAGLWHGAGKYFIYWGLYHGGLLVLYRFFPLDKWLVVRLGFAGKVIAKLIMFSLVVFGWTLFYSGGNGSFDLIFYPDGSAKPTLSISALWYGLFLFSLPLIFTDALSYLKHREFTDLWNHFSIPVKAVVLVLTFYSILMFGVRKGYAFIYFQF